MDSGQFFQMNGGQVNPVGGQMPPVQPVQPMPPMQPVQPAGPGMPMVQQVHVMPPQKKDVAGLIKTIVIVVVSLIAVTFIGLFIWMFTQYDEVKTDVDGQISKAVAAAKDEQAEKDEKEFVEREKYPYKTFSGPEDYGELTFEYPKTWSVYISKDAATGGDFIAYFNPVQVDPISSSTVNALRLTILDKSFDTVTASYRKELNKKNSNLTVESVTVNGVTADRYTGTIPGTDLYGYIVVFKIRDKTAVLRTDSVLFKDDFNKLLETVTFNA